MAYFPAEPERFVGQGRIMAAGSRTLAPFSGRAGILLVGPAGAGKTACALELAYRYEGSFAASAFWQAPTRDEEWAGALADFAAQLDIQLRDYRFTMASHMSTAADLEAFLPRLRQLLRDQGLLLVLDNLESLLTSDGEWRDPRWATLMEALTTHHGESRVILTSRVGIATVNSRLVEVHRVSALSSGESVLLARELPHLATLLRTSSPAGEPNSGLNPAELARRVITMAQGSPRLLELADATAADPALLARALDQNADSSPGAAPGATLTDGGGLDTAQLSVALGAWTASAVANLPEPSLLLLRMLCRLEDADRQPSVVESNWSDLWRRLELPGGPPPLADASAPLERTALTEAEPDDNGDESRPGPYLIHPGLAKEIRDTTPTEVSAAVDTEMAAYWISAFRYLSDQARNGQPSRELARRAAISAAAYLSRLQDWRSATQLLSAVLDMDHSTATAQALIPSLRRVAETSGQSTATLLLADALTETDAREAEALLRSSYDSAVANQDHRLASAVAGRLVVVLVSAGRLEALELCGEKVSHSRQAGLDPWSVLADEARTTEILSQMGRHDETLSQVQSLRGEMAELPSAPADFDGPEPWRVREKILRIGQESAQAVRDWRLALEINAEIAESEQWRGAPASLLAATQFNSWWPLAQTGRLDEAEQSLLGCQQTFEENGDIDALARVLRARANLAARHDLFDQAVALAQASIRLCYQRPDPAVVATCHDQLATYLSQASVPRKRLAQRAHRLAAALLLEIIGEAYRLIEIIKSLAADMKDTPDSSAVDMPSTLESIDNLCAETDGVEFATLISSIQPDARSVQEAVDQILASAGDLGSRDTVANIVAQWEPVVAAVATAVTTEHTPAELDALLDDLGGMKDWTSLVSALRRVLAGERGRDRLEAGLDEIDTAILAATLDRLPEPR